MKKSCLLFALTLVLVLSVSSIACAASSRFVTIGTGPTSASTYSYWVALSKAISDAYPEFKISVSEGQGTYDTTKKLFAGSVNMGGGMSNSDYECYYGVGIFKEPNKNLRNMWYWDAAPLILMVTQDSGVKNVRDLEGKKWNPGGAGTGSALVALAVLDALEIKPDLFEAGQASAADAVTNRQIIGMGKTGQTEGMDSLFLQLQASVPMTLVNMTKEDAERVNAKYPYLIPSVIPAGTYPWITEDIQTVSVFQTAIVTPDSLSQEDVYKILKTMDSPEGRKLWTVAYPNAANVDIVDFTFKSQVPLHLGTIQYFEEKGIKVPDHLLPPEYKK